MPYIKVCDSNVARVNGLDILDDSRALSLSGIIENTQSTKKAYHSADLPVMASTP